VNFPLTPTVCIFTSLLFLSGYALQQKTVRDIHNLIHPKVSIVPVNDSSVPFIADKKQRVLGVHGSPTINWKRVAYARSVQEFSDVCEAVMLFAELTAQRSRAQKVLLYPGEWDDMAAHGHGSSKQLETSIRLLKQAQKAYHVALIPVQEGYGYQTRDRSMDVLANMLALTSFERVIYLQPRGLVMDAEILDSLFKAPVNASITALDGAYAKPQQSLLIKPSLALAKRPAIAKEKFGSPILERDPLSGVILPTSYMRDLPEEVDLDLDADNIYDTTGYLRFTDSDILGPEFDLKKGTFARVQPRDLDLQVIWRNAYDHFRLMRMNYCGLDLQPIASEIGNPELK
jgi:hypothetical protein